MRIFNAAFRVSVALLFVCVLSGCMRMVKSDTVKDYETKGVRTVAVLPIDLEDVSEEFDAEKKKIAALFTKYAEYELKARGYKVLPGDAVDAALGNAGKEPVAGMKTGELAGLLSVDAVLLIKITRWKSSVFVPRAAIKMTAVYEIYDASGRLWWARGKVSEALYRLEEPILEKGVAPYEAKIEMLSSAVFTKMPKSPVTDGGGEKKFFDWLK
ncbi:MAG: hypothetical protein OEV59_07845 [Deltaproteobacteria bacterium]|nr:hypothetical protein [Deltaproteobacteria bacterium]